MDLDVGPAKVHIAVALGGTAGVDGRGRVFGVDGGGRAVGAHERGRVLGVDGGSRGLRGILCLAALVAATGAVGGGGVDARHRV